jgi:hypothetical protein
MKKQVKNSTPYRTPKSVKRTLIRKFKRAFKKNPKRFSGEVASLYKTTNRDRMFVYLWSERGDTDECKFGERWVKKGLNPYDECLKRIRQSVGVRKDKFDEGNIEVKSIWDVTEYAKSIGRCYQQSRVDDFIREKIGFRKGTTGEIHTLSADVMKTKVDTFLSSVDQPKPVVSLSTSQYNTVAEVKTAIQKGYRRFMLELAARFGKTISSAAMSVETDTELTIVASYVKTVFTSFQNDINSFEQFRHIVHIDATDDDYKKQVKISLAAKKKVFVYVSLCPGSKRDDRLKFLCGVKGVSRMVIIDEGDFGAHRENQVAVLKDNLKSDDVLLIMTGTNADRAASSWDIDYPVSVTYFELLVNKRESTLHKMSERQMVFNSKGLKNFNLDRNRDLSYPSVSCYQMDLISSVDMAIKRGFVLDDEFKNLPSWQKFVQHPMKGKGWYTTVIEALFKGKHNLNELNVDFQLGTVGRRISMMFFPDNTRKTSITEIVQITSATLSEYVVIELSGNVTTQRQAEQLVKETMESNPDKSIIIISAKMAQRSFSIPQLDEVYLCYDAGDNGATIQKMSRALTPNGTNDKTGKIFSLSFDPNRDDKFDTLLIQTALNLLKGNENKTDIAEQLKRILSSIDIFSCTDDGSIKFDTDTYIESALQRKTISRVMGMKTDVSHLPVEILSALASGRVDLIRNQIREVAHMGKVKDTVKSETTSPKTPTSKELNDLKKVTEMVVSIYEHSDILLNVGKSFGAKNIRQCFRFFERKRWQSIITDEFGLDYDVIKYLFFSGCINENWVNILHSTKASLK